MKRKNRERERGKERREGEYFFLADGRIGEVVVVMIKDTG